MTACCGSCARGTRARSRAAPPSRPPARGTRPPRRVLYSYRSGVAIGLINLVNILQPEVICMGGGVSNADDDLLLDPVRELVRQGSFDKTMPHPPGPRLPGQRRRSGGRSHAVRLPVKNDIYKMSRRPLSGQPARLFYSAYFLQRAPCTDHFMSRLMAALTSEAADNLLHH